MGARLVYTGSFFQRVLILNNPGGVNIPATVLGARYSLKV